MKSRVENRVAGIRKRRGTGAAELARRIGVSRQTVYAIEAGTYVPNTEVALNLARELEVTVDELFALRTVPGQTQESSSAEILSVAAQPKGQPVRICQVGERLVGVPVNALPYYMPEADGVIGNSASSVIAFGGDEGTGRGLVLAGCDPAAGLLSRMVEKTSGVEIVSAAASSSLALTWLFEGKVHIAGSHLEDPKTGEFNLPYLRKQFSEEDFSVVTFARWEQGLVTAPGNPGKLTKMEHLAEPGVRFVNREPGSGSRGLADTLIAKCGVDSADIHGYDRIACGHLAAAWSVFTGDADACVATRSAAQAFGLDFVPLHEERYDLVMRRSTAGLPSVQAFLDVLQRLTLRRKLEVLAGYDTSETGRVIA